VNPVNNVNNNFRIAYPRNLFVSLEYRTYEVIGRHQGNLD